MPYFPLFSGRACGLSRKVGTLDPATMIVTALMIRMMPTMDLGERVSPNAMMPTNTAVTGSSAPRIAVGVDPIVWIAFVVQRIETRVRKTAMPTRQGHVLVS